VLFFFVPVPPNTFFVVVAAVEKSVTKATAFSAAAVAISPSAGC